MIKNERNEGPQPPTAWPPINSNQSPMLTIMNSPLAVPTVPNTPLPPLATTPGVITPLPIDGGGSPQDSPRGSWTITGMDKPPLVPRNGSSSAAKSAEPKGIARTVSTDITLNETGLMQVASQAGLEVRISNGLALISGLKPGSPADVADRFQLGQEVAKIQSDRDSGDGSTFLVYVKEKGTESATVKDVMKTDPELVMKAQQTMESLTQTASVLENKGEKDGAEKAKESQQKLRALLQAHYVAQRRLKLDISHPAPATKSSTFSILGSSGSTGRETTEGEIKVIADLRRDLQAAKTVIERLQREKKSATSETVVTRQGSDGKSVDWYKQKISSLTEEIERQQGEMQIFKESSDRIMMQQENEIAAWKKRSESAAKEASESVKKMNNEQDAKILETLEQSEKRLEEAARQEKEQKKEISSLQNETQALQNMVKVLGEQLIEAKTTAAESTASEMQAKDNELQAKGNKLEDLKKQLSSALSLLDSKESEIVPMREEVARLREEVAQQNEKLAAVSKSGMDVTQVKEQYEATTQKLRDELKATVQQLNAVTKEKAELDAKLGTYQEDAMSQMAHVTAEMELQSAKDKQDMLHKVGTMERALAESMQKMAAKQEEMELEKNAIQKDYENRLLNANRTIKALEQEKSEGSDKLRKVQTNTQLMLSESEAKRAKAEQEKAAFEDLMVLKQAEVQAKINETERDKESYRRDMDIKLQTLQEQILARQQEMQVKMNEKEREKEAVRRDLEDKVMTVQDQAAAKHQEMIVKVNEAEREKQSLQQDLEGRIQALGEQLAIKSEELNREQATGLALKKKLHDMENLVEAKKKEIVELEHTMTTNQELKGEIETLQGALKEMTSSLQQSQQENSDLKEANLEHRKILQEEAQNRIQFLQDKLEEVTTTKKEKERVATEKERALAEKEARLQELEGHAANLGSRLEHVQSAMKKSAIEKQQLRSQIGNLENKVDLYAQELSASTDVKAQMESATKAQAPTPSHSHIPAPQSLPPTSAPNSIPNTPQLNLRNGTRPPEANVGLNLTVQPYADGTRKVIVTGISPGGPAAETGMITVGTEVVAINGEMTAMMSPALLEQAIEGPEGTLVSMFLQDPSGSRRFHVILNTKKFADAKKSLGFA